MPGVSDVREIIPASVDRAARASDAVLGALWAARHGWFVHPLRPDDKAPLWGDWENRATRDPDIIRSWPRRTTGYGIACGPSRLLVIDGDVPKLDTPSPPAKGIKDGLDMLAYLAEQRQASIDWATFQVTTGRGGSHLYYQAPDGVELRNTAYDPSKDPSTYLGWCIDTRCGGGYVVGPGSVVNGNRYTTLHSSAPAALPDWILILLTSRIREEAASQGRAAGARPGSQASAALPVAGAVGPEWAAAALRGEVERITSHPGSQGGRNHLLNSVAYTVGRLVGAGLLDRQVVVHELLDATRSWWGVGKPPFSQAEAEKTINSGLTAGERSPRVPEPRQERRRAA